MSSMSTVDYRIQQERRLFEQARQRWFALAGRAEAVNERAAARGYESRVAVARKPMGKTAAEVEAETSKLESSIERASDAIETRVFADRNRQVTCDLRDALDALEQREATELAAWRKLQESSEGAAVAERSLAVDLGPKTARLLATLIAPSAEIDAAAREVLSEPNRARARMLLRNLECLVAEANEKSRRDEAIRVELAELRSQARDLVDPDPVDGAIAVAQQSLDRGVNAAALVDRARSILAGQRECEGIERDRQFVLDAVVESFAALGYGADQIDVETADSIIIRTTTADSHGVRVSVSPDEIDLRIVRLSAHADDSGDRSAGEALCRAVDALPTELAKREVGSHVVKRVPPGVVRPKFVGRSVQKRTAQASEEHEHQRDGEA